MRRAAFLGFSPHRVFFFSFFLCGFIFGITPLVNAQVMPADPSPCSKEPHAPPPEFAAVSVHDHKDGSPTYLRWGLPSRFESLGHPVSDLILLAYFPRQYIASGTWPKELLKLDKKLGQSGWIEHDSIDVIATIPDELQDDWKSERKNGCLQAMLRSFLKERFGLDAAEIKKELSVYALMPRKRKINCTRASQDETIPSNAVRLIGGGTMIPRHPPEYPRTVFFKNTSMQELAAYLGDTVDRPIVDQTRLSGRFDFPLTLREEDVSGTDNDFPPTVWHVEELGLKLAPKKEMVMTLMIRSIHKADAN